MITKDNLAKAKFAYYLQLLGVLKLISVKRIVKKITPNLGQKFLVDYAIRMLVAIAVGLHKLSIQSQQRRLV